ncbi:MAG: DUF350 domain-containing protein [Fimbriimonas sp.]
MNVDVSLIARSMADSAALVGVTLLLLFVLKLVDDRITPFDDTSEINEHRNLALALRRAGMYLGLVIAMVASLTGPAAGQGLGRDLLGTLADGGVIIATLIVAQFLNGRLLFGGLAENAALREKNLAVGLTEFGQYVATGLVLNGAFTGEGSLLSGVTFVLVGQIALMLTFALYGQFARWDALGEIRKGNVAAGIAVGARLLAIGLLLKASISGDASQFARDLAAFAIWYVFGLVLMAVVSWLADLLFLPGLRIREAIVDDRNAAASAKVAGVTLATAITVAAVIAG